MFGTLNHVAIFVKDRKESIDFYTEILGAELLFTVDNESDGLLIAMLDLNGTKIELLEPPEEKELVEQTARATQNHYALDVDDVDEAVSYIRACGYEVEEPGVYDVPDFGKKGNDIRVAFFHGPNGERVEMFQQV